MNMKKLPLLALVAIALSSCNLANIIPTADITMSLVNDGGAGISQIEITRIYEDLVVGTGEDQVTTPCAVNTGYTVQRMRVKAYARPGSTGVDIESFSVDYFSSDGNRIPTARGESFRGKLAVTVPSGIVCAEKPSDEEPNGCTINSPNAKYDYGRTVYGEGILPIDNDVVARIFADSSSEGSYASVLFEGRDTNGNFYSKLVSPITIVVYRVCQ